MIDLRLKEARKFFLHVEVDSSGGKQWELTVVYASPNPKRHLWVESDGISVSNLGYSWAISIVSCEMMKGAQCLELLLASKAG